jgi:hypothetical protein
VVGRLALICLSLACSREVVDPIGPDVDPTDPRSVVGGVIHAARSGDPRPLATLCLAGVSEPSVARICDLGVDAPAWPGFRGAFARARLNGQPRVSGDRAAINFVYGPDAKRPETMELVRKGGRWYLARF